MKLHISLIPLALLFMTVATFGQESTNPIAREDAVLAADSSFDSAKTPKGFESFMQGIKFKNPTGYWHLVNAPVPTDPPEVQMEESPYYPGHGQPAVLGHYYVPRSGYESLTMEQRRQLRLP
jgi:hypothetical protein